MERAINRNVVKRVALLCSLLLAFGTSYSQERLRPCQRYSGYESYQKMLTGYMVPEGNIEWLVLFMLGPERSICYNLSTHELVATSSREVICKDWFKGERSIQTDRKAVLIEESVASLLSSVFSKAVTTARRVEDEPVPDGTLPPLWSFSLTVTASIMTTEAARPTAMLRFRAAIAKNLQLSPILSMKW